MEFHMINLMYMALPIRAHTEKMKFSCKDDCILMIDEAHTALNIYTDKYKFTTNINLKDESLGVIISDDLKWDKNTKCLVKKKTYSRTDLLRKNLPKHLKIKGKYNLELSCAKLKLS